MLNSDRSSKQDACPVVGHVPTLSSSSSSSNSSSSSSNSSSSSSSSSSRLVVVIIIVVVPYGCVFCRLFLLENHTLPGFRNDFRVFLGGCRT